MKNRSVFAASHGIMDEWKRFRCFLWENRWYLVLTSLFLILIYGQWIFELSPHIDTEDFINTPYSLYGLQSGRPGKFLTSFLFQLRWYNPYMSSVFGFLLLCMSGICFQYLLFRAGNIKCSASWVFALIAFCCPIMVEQLYFFSQIFEMAWAYVLCAVSAGLSFYGVLHHSWTARLASVVGMVWIFGTYQVFTVIYASAVIVCFLLLYDKWSADRGVSWKRLIFLIGQLIVWFDAAFLINTVINSIWFSRDAGYLNNMRCWSRDTVLDCIRNIQAHIASGFSGDGIYYSVFYGVFAVAAVTAACYNVWAKGLKTGWLYVLSVMMLQLCPFLMTVYLGKEPVIRSQLAYPIVLAFDAVLCMHGWSKPVWMKKIIQFLAVACLWMQLVPTMRLIYTDGIRAQEDRQLMSEISARIHEVSGIQKPVAFVGTYDNQLNNACLRGKMIGVSIFNIDADASPHYFFSTVRICENARVMGYSIEHATEEQVLLARKEALHMPVWPMSGSVKDAGDFIVVKLSDDKRPREVMTEYMEETEEVDLSKTGDDLVYEIETVKEKEKDGQLVVRGWLLEHGVSAVSKKPVVYLRKDSTGQYYRVATAKQPRADISSEFGNDELYRWCGFVALAPLADLEEPLNDYSFILGYEDSMSGEIIYLDTNIRLE